MKVAVILCALLVAASLQVEIPRVDDTAQEGMRLIETAPGEVQWVTENQRNKMLENKIHLMDITDQQTFVRPVGRAAPSIPTNLTHQAYVRDLLDEIDANQLTKTITGMSDFFTRYYTSDTGQQAAEWLAEQYEKIAAANDYQVEVELFNNNFKQPNVIARLAGTGNNADEVVILGGHLDSVTWPLPTSRSPGADDDASGSSNVLEVFRVLTQAHYQPSRTVEFHGYAAEEVGLLGSQNIANDYAKRGVNVAGMLQIDMTGFAGPSPSIKIVTDFTTPNLTSLVQKCAKEYSNLAVTTSKCGYACSDHASFFRAGFAAAFQTESGNYRQIHTVNDVLSNLNVTYSTEFVRTALGWVVEMASDESK